jgi:hypothetical protein
MRRNIEWILANRLHDICLHDQHNSLAWFFKFGFGEKGFGKKDEGR